MGTGVLGDNVHNNLVAYLGTLTDAQKRAFTDALLKSLLETEFNAVEDWIVAALSGVPYAEFNFEETANTNGGTATFGGWTKITDTSGNITTKSNSITSLSVALGVFSIPVGTYDIFSYHMFYETNTSRIRLRDITHSSTLLIGSCPFSSSGNNVTVESLCCGRIIIASPITAELEYDVSSTKATSGLGAASNMTERELYGQIIFRKAA